MGVRQHGWHMGEPLAWSGYNTSACTDKWLDSYLLLKLLCDLTLCLQCHVLHCM